MIVVVAAFIVVAQIINFKVAQGTSGHFVARFEYYDV